MQLLELETPVKFGQYKGQTLRAIMGKDLAWISVNMRLGTIRLSNIALRTYNGFVKMGVKQQKSESLKQEEPKTAEEMQAPIVKSEETTDTVMAESACVTESTNITEVDFSEPSNVGESKIAETRSGKIKSTLSKKAATTKRAQKKTKTAKK